MNQENNKTLKIFPRISELKFPETATNAIAAMAALAEPLVFSSQKFQNQ
jgi:hypothetical protein